MPGAGRAWCSPRWLGAVGLAVFDVAHPPELVAGLAPQGDEFAGSHGQVWQPHRFGQVLLEHQAELLGLLQRLHFVGDGFAQFGIGDLGKSGLRFSPGGYREGV